jgi:TusA-related sulfurtransferase
MQYFVLWQAVMSDGRKGEQEYMSEKNELDARGLVCPMPIIKLSKAIKELQPGDVLEVIANDPAFTSDVSTWCEKMGHELSEVSSRGEDLVARIVKK